MTDIVDPALEAYAAAHTTAPPEHLESLAVEVLTTLDSPHMMVGRLEGRFLEMITFALSATSVLEIGTFGGYSALSMAPGLAPGGRIISCEISAVHAEFARRHIAASPYAEQIDVIEGPALATIRSLPGPFDLVFIDADKVSYLDYFEAVKAAGLPVVLGLEVDYYQDRMEDVADLLDGYPFDVLLGSVHWLGTWRFDVLSDPQVLAEWDHRAIDHVWDEYTRAVEELAASGVCDVLAHPDLVKIAGRVPVVPDEFYDRITEAAVRSGMAAEVSSAGWRKPVGEEYPAPPLLRRFVEQGVPLTTASDAHTLPDVAERADDLRGLLTAAGVDTLRGYRQRQPHEVAVAPAPASPEQVTLDSPDQPGPGNG